MLSFEISCAPRRRAASWVRRGALEGVPVLSQIVSPDRWLLWLGVLFVLSVYYFPTGIVGRLRARALARRAAGAAVGVAR